MEIIEYFASDRQEHWLEQIGKCDWSAGQVLYKLLSRGMLSEVIGENPKILMLTEADALVSFCSYAKMDDIQPTELWPWVGFVYTFPEYRGHHYIGKLLQEAERLARDAGMAAIYISTGHTGLYEKYGFEFYQMMNDFNGEPSRVYRKHI